MQNIPVCEVKELSQVIGLISTTEPKPDDEKWIFEQIGRIEKSLKASKAHAKDLLVRVILSLDFMGRHHEKLAKLRVLAISPEQDMQMSPVLLSVLARVPATDQGLDDAAIFMAINKLLPQVVAP